MPRPHPHSRFTLAVLGAATLSLAACQVPGSSPNSGTGPDGSATTVDQLDGAFGEHGLVTTDLQPDKDDLAYAIAVQPDGKIVLAGTSGTSALTQTALVRYTADGKVDTSFGTEGLALSTKSVTSSAYALAIQADGKLVSGGWTANSGGSSDLLLTRHTTAGQLDTSFGASGHGLAGLNTAFGNAMAQQTDGKLLLAGRDTNLFTPDTLVARFHANGTLDHSWGEGGLARIDWGSDWDDAKAIAVLADGKVLVAGKTDQDNVALCRLKADGSLDTGFGNNGLVKRNLGEGNAVKAIALRSDGRIVLAGGSLVHAYLADGAVDPDFGDAGQVKFPEHQLNSLVVLPDGSLVAVGKDAKSVAVVKLGAQGKPVADFGKAGSLSLVSAVPSGEAFSVTRLASGKLLIAGKAFDEDDDFLLIRLNP
ncbi:hypothetical protein D3C87_413430 [compost metagenome]